MAWSGSPMTVSPVPSPLSRRSSAYWLASMSWYSSTLISRQRSCSASASAVRARDLRRDAQPGLLVGDAEIRGQARPRCVLPEDHQAKPVEGGDRKPGRLGGDQLVQPLTHLPGRAAGEGEGEAGLRWQAAF